MAFLITTQNSLAGAPLFEIGPDGDAYRLVDCSIPENNADLSICDNADDPGVGVISWETARSKAQGMNFRGFTCDLATPSTEQINDYLKTFPGFVDACNTCTGAGNQGFQVCAWFGIRDFTDDDQNGPYHYVNNLEDYVPCPFNPVCCNPRV